MASAGDANDRYARMWPERYAMFDAYADLVGEEPWLCTLPEAMSRYLWDLGVPYQQHLEILARLIGCGFSEPS